MLVVGYKKIVKKDTIKNSIFLDIQVSEDVNSYVKQKVISIYRKRGKRLS